MLLLPIQRSDILGKDEDLEAIEEFYLREIEETVHADMIQKVKKKEQEIKEKIKTTQVNDKDRL